MTVDSCMAFLQTVRDSDELKGELKAMSHSAELVAMGRRRGYTFDVEEIGPASAALVREEPDEQGPPGAPSAAPSKSVFYHYEFDLDLLEGFEEVRDTLSQLKIKPTTVDMGRLADTFRADDFEWTGMSPAAPGFHDIYEAVMASHWGDATQNGAAEQEFGRRDFHLVNLDTHTDHDQYEAYFAAKKRMIGELENIFSGDVQFSGSLWYPPASYRLWHTNETQPGWRMYLIDLDGDEGDGDTSFFRYMNPETKEIVTLEDRPRMMRLFKIEQEEDKRFWHCIVNPSRRNRWSFGFAVPDDWMSRLHALR